MFRAIQMKILRPPLGVVRLDLAKSSVVHFHGPNLQFIGLVVNDILKGSTHTLNCQVILGQVFGVKVQ